MYIKIKGPPVAQRPRNGPCGPMGMGEGCRRDVKNKGETGPVEAPKS